MKRNFICCCIILLIAPTVVGQKITYSEYVNEDNQDIRFEILGKLDSNFVVYKNVRWKHMLAIYNNDMKLIENSRLKFIPDKTSSIDFIVYPRYFFMIYQYQKNSIFHCMAVKMDNKGNRLSEPVELDTTKINMLADNKVYSIAWSENKQRILIYKLHLKKEKLTIVSKVFNSELKLLDSTRQVYPFDEGKEIYSELYVADNGALLFTRGKRRNSRENFRELELIMKFPGDSVFQSKSFPLANKFIDEIKIKIDNLNGRFILNSFYYSVDLGSIDGLFSAILDSKGNLINHFFYPFDDALRNKIADKGSTRFAFDNLFLRNTYVKKDGGLIITAEDFSSQSKAINNNWNRWDYLGSYPYAYAYDNYLASPSYEDNYRPINSYSSFDGVRYYYNDILVICLDSSLQLKWRSLIYKKQFDDDNDNYLSYGTMFSGSALHFLFIEDNKRNQIVSNQGIFASGELKRFPTLKSREAGYTFMPRLSKQVGLRQIIMPCIYHGNIAFAKVEFE